MGVAWFAALVATGSLWGFFGGILLSIPLCAWVCGEPFLNVAGGIDLPDGRGQRLLLCGCYIPRLGCCARVCSCGSVVATLHRADIHASS